MTACCKNCRKIRTGEYCSDCGQKFSVDRISLSYLLQQFSKDVLQFERGLLYTAVTLFYRPGQVIKDYISGKRISYTKPFTYLVLISAMYIYLSTIFGFETVMQDLIAGIQHGLANDEKSSSSAMLSILTWFNSHYVASVLLSVPALSLATRYAFYKSGFNFYEHFVLNLYMSCQRMIIYAALGPIASISKVFEPIPLVLSLAYTVFAYFQIFDSSSIKRRIVSVVYTYLLFGIITFLFLVIVAVIHTEISQGL